ncbi:hypothetical protein [Psychrobium sp. 1_MG-2023]|uniref:hypothetical protein n=1 Tax=Psychrobium sp. 1_MG-2023 TaxID=3062624 RepID=UPI000C330EC0|nr:hypothetical protein [Psychrobium sp. 1_MG-2023]MDP2561349.1 hypothetical protein [Psychrobium sp. 1_MG-2023]PKF54162.1 hypothetical protein CW748_17045 [Alteromonadales bacterium alter-6D02]
MNFEQLLNNFDMGVCVEQLQREALVDLVVLFVEIDGVVEDKEMQYTLDWMVDLVWENEKSPLEYLHSASLSAREAIETSMIEDYILHRTKHIIDSPAKSLALALAKGVALSDGELAPEEAQAIKFLESCFNK